MKKTRRNSGFSLIELLCALLILVILVIGIGVSMDAGVGIYRDATFEAESATLAGILNTSIGDILRYSIDVRETTQEEKAEHGSDVKFVFTSTDYGIQDAYFYIPPHMSGGTMGPVQMKNLRNPAVVELVNTGAYPDLVVSDFEITYTARQGTGVEGGYFEITYLITSETDETKTRSVETIVRLMND